MEWLSVIDCNILAGGNDLRWDGDWGPGAWCRRGLCWGRTGFGYVRSSEDGGHTWCFRSIGTAF